MEPTLRTPKNYIQDDEVDALANEIDATLTISASTTNPGKRFTCFGKLPLELQRKIWVSLCDLLIVFDENPALSAPEKSIKI